MQTRQIGCGLFRGNLHTHHFYVNNICLSLIIKIYILVLLLWNVEAKPKMEKHEETQIRITIAQLERIEHDAIEAINRLRRVLERKE